MVCLNFPFLTQLSVFLVVMGFFSFFVLIGEGMFVCFGGLQHGVVSLAQDTHLNLNPCPALTSLVTLGATYYISGLYCSPYYSGNEATNPRVVEKTKERKHVNMHLA